jgi:TolB-like protein
VLIVHTIAKSWRRSHQEMTVIDIKLFGAFEIRDVAGRLIPVKAKKNRALLAALALAPGQALPRERLMNLLWSDRGDAQARSSLRQALLGLRSDLAGAETGTLHIDDEKVSINPGHVGVDAIEFVRLAALDDLGSLRRAYALYRGDLLADTFVQDPEFEEWLAGERQRLADTAIGVIERLCRQESGAARIDHAKRLVALDPLRENSHRLLMQAYLDAGERALALRQYELCRELLREELQIAPGEQTEALRRRCTDASSPATQKRQPDSRQPHANGANPRVDERPLVAVLPFQTFSSDPEMEGFCDGLSEDIITGLSRIGAIRVVARSTMFTYKHRAADIRAIGRDLGASYVLEGSVRASGNNLRIAAQLIDAVDGHHVWAEQIDRANGEAFDLQNDITRTIVASVQTQLHLNEGRTSYESGEPARASLLLARAWRRFLNLTEESLQESKALAERALEAEPRNATAHRMLAIVIYHQVYMGFLAWDRTAIDLLFKHAKIAIESDGADEYCHWAMECAYLLKGEHELAAASLRRALEINPNFALAYGSMGTVLAWAGEYEESVRSNELALRVNPQDPSNFYRHFGLALAHYLASRTPQALTHARLVAQARSKWWLGQLVYAAALVQSGRSDEARRAIADLAGDSRDVARLEMLPFKNASDRDRLLNDLRIAGLD